MVRLINKEKNIFAFFSGGGSNADMPRNTYKNKTYTITRSSVIKHLINKLCSSTKLAVIANNNIIVDTVYVDANRIYFKRIKPKCFHAVYAIKLI